MKTLVYPPTSPFGRTRTVGVIAHPLTGAEAFRIAAQLTGDGLPVLPAVDEHHVLHLWPARQTSTAEEVRILAAFEAATDMRVRWHGEQERVRPTCLLCGYNGHLPLVHDLCGPCTKVVAS